ncbi:hypothetical protein JRC04_05350 [Mycolicibacterium sp. S2-37]|uniref:hypothetical protein n=1 Tax=Mycolicibacterium sp. S2-37 TaxID=2810297 RepID=UPI001A94F450|nr:hypothetical protein [Mycolicibacterium sp. S2-37]MBO0676881.1 hypothetical protein [Mycolicibacterium sp. S2-37]
MTDTPYAGTAWLKGMIEASEVDVLPIILRDLRDAALYKGIGPGAPIELWESDRARGFYMGDTSALSDSGWTYLATL